MLQTCGAAWFGRFCFLGLCSFVRLTMKSFFVVRLLRGCRLIFFRTQNWPLQFVVFDIKIEWTILHYCAVTDHRFWCSTNYTHIGYGIDICVVRRCPTSELVMHFVGKIARSGWFLRRQNTSPSRNMNVKATSDGPRLRRSWEIENSCKHLWMHSRGLMLSFITRAHA